MFNDGPLVAFRNDSWCCLLCERQFKSDDHLWALPPPTLCRQEAPPPPPPPPPPAQAEAFDEKRIAQARLTAPYCRAGCWCRRGYRAPRVGVGR